MTVNWSFLTIYRKIGPYPEMSVYKSGGISLYEDRGQKWCVLDGLLVCLLVSFVDNGTKMRVTPRSEGRHSSKL